MGKFTEELEAAARLAAGQPEEDPINLHEVRAEIARLALMDRLEYGVTRKAAAKKKARVERRHS